MSLSMSPSVELALRAENIPFMCENSYHNLPTITEDNIPEPIDDIWRALSLLIDRHNDRTVRQMLTAGAPENTHNIPIVRVGIYNGGYGHDMHSGDYDYHVSQEVLNEALQKQFLMGTPEWGYTDNSTLKITDRGMEGLIEYLNELQKNDVAEAESPAHI